MPNAAARQEIKNELELKLILGSNFKGWNVSENFLAVKNLAGEPWEFGYAVGASRPLALKGAAKRCNFCPQNFAAGVEMYGGLGDTASFGLRETSHYLAPVVAWNMPSGWTLRASPTFGLNDSSRRFMIRWGIAKEFSGFGDLVKVAADLPLPSADHMQLRFKPASTWRYVGKPVPIVDLTDIVRGRATYGIDVVVPGMKHASIERCPVYGGHAKSFDPKEALAVPGVEQVIEMQATPIPSGFNPLGGLAVIASNTWSAQQGRDKLKIDWDLGPNAGYDTTAYRAELEATAKEPGRLVRGAQPSPA